jgi:hypothetical protein
LQNTHHNELETNDAEENLLGGQRINPEKSLKICLDEEITQ